MKIKLLLVLLIFSISTTVIAQSNNYKPSQDKTNDLVHTKLNVSFDMPNSQLMGEAWVTATPHYNSVDKITLDAKGMIIHDVKMGTEKMQYNYFENKELIIELDKTYSKNENFTVYVKYTSRPEKLVDENGKKKVSNKGLYFIDPKNEDPNKPTQIWTEGEAENNSVWFPTIDAPNQKMSQEISMTVPKEFVTLSNGTLLKQTENSDGTRTDYWKQDLKHAPYLFFMGVGEFSIVTDTWNGKLIEYYVEKEYEHLAIPIFGKTPEILSFFEELLGVDYPWVKYSQIVVRDYVSGAMENTTAVVLSDTSYQEEGELIDENIKEETIVHEIFHHWFGDFVTAESWSNLALNEAFANYGEYLWFEHAYGRDYADDKLLKNKAKYLKDTENAEKNLIRFNHDSPDDMFDRVSYEKGGLILHMLRNYLGDAQFFAGLQKYLEDNQFGAVEAHHLRLAFEEVSGKDLNWFFNQWFFGDGHPELLVTQQVGGFNKQVTVNIRQAEKAFNFPLTIDIYEKDGRKSSHDVWVEGNYNSFTFPVSSAPRLINVNPSGVLLAEIAHTKTLEEMIYQYNHAKEYKSREEALQLIVQNQDDENVFKTLTKALNDKSEYLRIFALEKLNLVNKYTKGDAIKKVEYLAKNDPFTLVQAAANTTLAKLVDPKYINHFVAALASKSFKVKESAIIGLYQLDKENALLKVNALSEKAKESMATTLTGFYIENRDDKYMPFIANNIASGLFFVQEKKVANAHLNAFEWIAKSDNVEAVSNLTTSLVNIGVKYKKQGGDAASINFLRQMQYLQKESKNANKAELITIIRSGMAKLVN